MNALRHRRLTQIFGELCERSPAERRLRLKIPMREDPELARDVEALLAHSDLPIIDLDDTGQLSSIISELCTTLDRQISPPARIGDYEILEQLGHGGMAIVYLAQQHQPLERKVAVKVIRPGMGSPQVLTRFDMERRTLAAMNHPGIAAIHDTGVTDDARPYFVMQHVAGERITRCADQNSLTINQRLDLFVKVCDAVAHAHQRASFIATSSLRTFLWKSVVARRCQL